MHNFGKDFSLLSLYKILAPIDQPMEQQIKISSNSLPPDITVFQNALNQQMKFETEPILSFRGRLLSEYLPKKGIKKTGEKSVPNKPSYFADRHNRHYLKLLVCYFNTKIFNRISVLDSGNIFMW